MYVCRIRSAELVRRNRLRTARRRARRVWNLLRNQDARGQYDQVSLSRTVHVRDVTRPVVGDRCGDATHVYRATCQGRLGANWRADCTAEFYPRVWKRAR